MVCRSQSSRKLSSVLLLALLTFGNNPASANIDVENSEPQESDEEWMSQWSNEEDQSMAQSSFFTNRHPLVDLEAGAGRRSAAAWVQVPRILLALALVLCVSVAYLGNSFGDFSNGVGLWAPPLGSVAREQGQYLDPRSLSAIVEEVPSAIQLRGASVRQDDTAKRTFQVSALSAPVNEVPSALESHGKKPSREERLHTETLPDGALLDTAAKEAEAKELIEDLHKKLTSSLPERTPATQERLVEEPMVNYTGVGSRLADVFAKLEGVEDDDEESKLLEERLVASIVNNLSGQVSIA